MMHFSAAAVVALAFILPACSAPGPLVQIEKFNGETTGRYIVKLKPSVAISSFIEYTNTTTTHQWKLINAFAGELGSDALNALRADPNVESICEDGIMQTSLAIQTNAPWGLARLSSNYRLTNQDPNALNFRFNYDETAGAGVDIYIIDSGVYTNHTQFGGRARWGAAFGGNSFADGTGHGTHCAGIAAGSQFGVAKAANIIAVRVFGDNGKGPVSDILSGMDFAFNSSSTSGRPSTASMSISGAGVSALDDAVASLTNAGIHVVVAAGNDNSDAGWNSPARAPSAITVGASNISDTRAWFSNYGSVVDIFAPGENVISSFIGSPSATQVMSGTSMATPHVAGLVAFFIRLYGNTSPAAMAAKIKSYGLNNVLKDLPAGTTNLLANNGYAPE